jgi:dephospho-CoA kinase
MGCGKSTVGKVLEKNHNDVYLFDCDKVAKEELFDEKNRKEIKKILGEEIIDKEKIAQLIFNNSDKKRVLEEFIHPLVWKKLEEEIQKRDGKTIFLVESAIFFEIGKDKDINKVILVNCDLDKQKNRIKKRNNWSDKQINERLRYQMPNQIKEKKAVVVINNNCSLEELEIKTEKLYFYMKNKSDYKLVL